MRSDTIHNDLNVVLVSSTYFKDLIGGGERYPWELAKALSKYITVTLIVFGTDRRTEKISETLTVEKYPAIISLPPLLSKTNPFPLTLSFLKEINKADIVHLHQFNTLISNLVILYARVKNKFICVTDHGGGIFKLSKLFPIIGKSVDLYMLVALFSYKKFEKYKRDYHIIYGGVDTSKFYPLNIEKENMLLFAGRIIPRKGVDILVRAVQRLNTKVHIVGKSGDERYIKLLKKLDMGNKIIFKFDVSDDNLIKEYNSALVTVLPSVYLDCYHKRTPEAEIFPLTVVESMACRTPVICTDAGGMPEIVENGKNGFIVPTNDPKILEEKIRYFLDNPDESKRMGDNARRTILEDFTWDAVARRCLEGYTELLNREHRNEKR
jgi:glycosyltransferase involved in cell wall biosynthesis